MGASGSSKGDSHAELSDDLTPELAGNLDCKGKNLTDINSALTDILEIINAGGGDNPKFTSNNAGQFLSLLGGLIISANLLVNGKLVIADAKDIELKTTTGTKIGTATNQKLAFYGTPPITQPTALTGIDANVIDAVYDATEEAVLNNVRTRINELETKLKSLGFLP